MKTILLSVVFLGSFLLLGSETIINEEPLIILEVPTVNHESERKEIEARCYANETSKSKQDFYIFVEKLTPKEIEAAKKIVE